jgi:hypothetical protein
MPSAPGACDRKWLPPTSGNRPMFTSGIAIFVRSVTMRRPLSGPPWAMPMPPPITTPSISAIYGFG